MDSNTEYKLLDKISKPSDVKKLNDDELKVLASEIRTTLINTVSKTGGHLASNLGVVELTIALHKVFNSPYDKIVWDVGHQTYVHKLLTGRFDEFSTLRQPGGISGFCNPDESEHDIFFSGHSSTSISAAYGIAQANLIKNNKNYSIAIIGDGAFTGGMAYEALNNAGRTKTNFIVILNDNEMSISKNVGSFSSYLAVIKARPAYFRLKARTESFLNKIPFIGKKLSNNIFDLKTRLKSLLYNKSTMFEELGFRYMGPIDGHDINVLCDALEGAKTADYPVLLHIKTVKGKGCEFAEQHPSDFHGIGMFDPNSGEFRTSGLSNSQMFGSSLVEFASKDKRICAVTAAMGLGTGLKAFEEKFPSRFFDVGIAEEHAVTFSAGLSKGGMIPVFAVYSAFLQRTYDQIVHDVALQKLKMILAIDRAGFVDGDGETHHGLFDISILNSIPNVSIYSPCTYQGISHCLFKAFYKDEGLVAIRYPKGKESPIPENYLVSEMDYDVYGNDGDSIALVCYGRVFSECAFARNILSEKGIKVKLIKLNKIKPINTGSVEAVLNCSSVYFFEESEKTGSIGESFNMLLSENGYNGKFLLKCIDDCFVHHSKATLLLAEFGLNCDSIVKKITEDI